MKKLLSVMTMLVAIQTVCTPVESVAVKKDHKMEALKIQAYYRKLVNAGDKRVVPNINVIEHVLKAIDHTLPTYFPNGPFTREDFIAIAMLESDFHQYEVGTSGERGIFQIMKHNVKGKKSWEYVFDIDLNTKLAMKVMKWKLEERHNDFRMSVIAYNGVVRRHGKVNERYWRTFLKHKEIAHEILNG